METFKTRGYIVKTTLKYLREGLEPSRSAAALARLSADQIRSFETAKPTEWYPAEQTIVIMLDALIHATNGDRALAENDLVAAGKFAGMEATNTFLRLLMKVLTPGLFAKKLPSLYERDNSKGRVSVDVGDERLLVRFDDMKGHPHMAPMSMGWVSFAIEAMGKHLSKTQVHGWSFENPDPDSFSLELVWSA